MNDTERRVRRAIDREFGPQSDQQFLMLLSDTLQSYMKRARAAWEAQAGPIDRKPTNLANVQTILDKYPKTIRTVMRELSIYRLTDRSGSTIASAFLGGIAVAIIDHILEAGELEGKQ